MSVLGIIGLALLGVIVLFFMFFACLSLWETIDEVLNLSGRMYDREMARLRLVEATGVDVAGRITAFRARDLEGAEVDYRVRVKYKVGWRTYRKTIKFCIDWVHVGYASLERGVSFGPYTEEGVRKALQAGTELAVRMLPGKPRVAFVRLPPPIDMAWERDYFL